MLLRLKPGPAEAEFGITAAPNAALADGHGRLLRGNFSLRGDIDRACRLLETLHGRFDAKAAARPPYRPPAWARPLLAPNGVEAMVARLERMHPARGKPKAGEPTLADLGRIAGRLEREIELIRFAENYILACESRVPPYGRTRPGYGAEVDLLRSLTWCRNDRVKFRALQAWGRFAPVGEVGFLFKRVERRREGCRNPNLILCRAMEAVGLMAARFPGARDRQSAGDHRALVGALAGLTATLDREGRNNSACRLAARSIQAIAAATGAPEALAAYFHCFKAPPTRSAWLRRFNERFAGQHLAWLQAVTGQKLPASHGAWKTWYAGCRQELVWDRRRLGYRRDRQAAVARRRHLDRLGR